MKCWDNSDSEYWGMTLCLVVLVAADARLVKVAIDW